MRAPNRAEMCTAIVPHRTSLDMPIGKFDDMPGMHEMQAKLMALTYIAIKENVFSKEWLVGRPGELPEVLTEADPINGRTGVVTGGVLQPQTLNPSPMSMQMMGQLESNQRQQGGMPSEMGGESPTNVRTGKRGMDIMSAQIDFPIQEAQTILARSKEYENCAAIAVSKGYYGNKTVSFYVRKMKGGRGKVTYVPNEIFDTDVNFVDYPHAGSDANQLAVLIGQLVSLKLISEDTGRKLHPLIDDPFHESEIVQAEALNDALLAAVTAQVQQGTLSAPDVANIVIALESDRSTLAQAVAAVHAKEQARQAAAPSGAPGEGAPGLAPGPGGAPGGAAVPPGAGAPPTVGPPTPAEGNLAASAGRALHGGAAVTRPTRSHRPKWPVAAGGVAPRAPRIRTEVTCAKAPSRPPHRAGFPTENANSSWQRNEPCRWARLLRRRRLLEPHLRPRGRCPAHSPACPHPPPVPTSPSPTACPSDPGQAPRYWATSTRPTRTSGSR